MLEPLAFPFQATSWRCVLFCFVEELLLYQSQQQLTLMCRKSSLLSLSVLRSLTSAN